MYDGDEKGGNATTRELGWFINKEVDTTAQLATYMLVMYINRSKDWSDELYTDLVMVQLLVFVMNQV